MHIYNAIYKLHTETEDTFICTDEWHYKVQYIQPLGGVREPFFSNLTDKTYIQRQNGMAPQASESLVVRKYTSVAQLSVFLYSKEVTVTLKNIF